MPSASVVPPTLLAAAGSHAGLQRDNNEDRYHCDPQRGIFLVIDGVGGHAAGEKAAATALTMIRARLERETGSPAERVREAITLANNEIFRLAASEPAWNGMACVLTVALVRNGRVTIGHVGDTRLYAFTGGVPRKVTHDHSPIGEREDQGDLDELQAMRHPRRNEIYRDVGSQRHEPEDEEFIETLEMPFDPAGALLLCTDGLSDLVPSAGLARIVSAHPDDPTRVVERLIEAANAAGGKDNVTAVFVAGPEFAEAVRRQAQGIRPREASGTRNGGGLGARLASWPAIVLYGMLAGLAAAAALLFFTDSVPSRLLDASRPAGWSRTWLVDDQAGGDFSTIQEALQRARPGDVVEVNGGTYIVPLTVPPGVHLVARKPREAILRPAQDAASHTPALTVGGASRIAGFKVEATGLATGVLAQEGEVELIDLEVTGADNAAVMFAAGSRAALRSSYLHDNPGAGIIVEGQAMPRLLHDVVAANGKARGAGATRQADGSAGHPTPAVVLQPGASAVFFGNIVAGNADDQVAGLAPERRADLLRDNVIGVPAPARTAPRTGTPASRRH